MILPTSSSAAIVLSLVSVHPQITPGPLRPRVELHKRNEVCGMLDDYPNAQAPICSGKASLCTFSSGRQGCCDKSEDCTFYSSCNGGLADSCTDPGCLQCPSTKAYCTRYEFDGGGRNIFTGFGCGLVSLTEPAIYGTLATQNIADTVTGSDKPSSDTSRDESETAEPTTTSEPRATSRAASATGAAQSDTKAEGEGGGKKLSNGAIGGVAVGGAASLAVIIIVLYICISRRRAKRRRDAPQLAQRTHRQVRQASYER